MAKAQKTTSNARGYWQEQLSKSSKRLESFHASGEIIIDKYRIEKADGAAHSLKNGADKYNILYSSTETIRPSLYAQTPKPVAELRHKDRANPVAQGAVAVLESCVGYALGEVNFDETMENVILDYALPGWGVAWVRYLPTFKPATDGTGAVVNDEYGKPAQVIDFEALGFDYINWKDFRCGQGRYWGEVPWVAKGVYMDKQAVADNFGDDIANAMQYPTNDNSRAGVANVAGNQVLIWEIWDKRKREVHWLCDAYADDLLRTLSDPLRLKGFFPCPKPLRAISTPRTMTPRPFYAQYQSQAEQMDSLTARIRYLTEALQVRGVFDGSMTQLSALLSPRGGNKMIPVDNWQQFVQGGGMAGVIQFVPIQEVAAVLMQLLQAREVCKAEIYEITGFSDILRGVSKASETLGAQQIKTDWAGSRLKVMQREVQRFCRDAIRLMAEVISEHFTPESIAEYSGFDAKAFTDENAKVQAVETFKQVVTMLRTEKERCALIDVETDSTILPDEAQERQDRLEFLGQIGAFLQQAGPIIQQYPEMRGLMASIMMFTVRTFRASRPIEQEFERFQKALEATPPADPNKDKQNDSAQKMQLAQFQAQSAMQVAQFTAASNEKIASIKANSDAQKEQNRHQERMLELQIKQAEMELEKAALQIKMAELGIAQAGHGLNQQQQQHDQQMDQHNAALAAGAQQHDQQMDRQEAAQAALQPQTAPPA